MHQLCYRQGLMIVINTIGCPSGHENRIHLFFILSATTGWEMPDSYYKQGRSFEIVLNPGVDASEGLLKCIHTNI
jgi:hypothetical protein